MTQEDIIRMAREAGLHSAVLLHIYDGREGALTDQELAELWRIERFFRLAYESGAAAEREACAKVCDAAAKKMDDEGEGSTGYIGWVTDCAAAIRARGNK